MAKKVISKSKNIVHTIEVDGKQYEIARRTQRVQNEINAWAERRETLTDLESFEFLFELLLGTEAKNTLVEAGEDADIDYLNEILDAVYELFYLEKNKQQMETMRKQMASLQPVLDKVPQVKQAMELAEKGK